MKLHRPLLILAAVCGFFVSSAQAVSVYLSFSGGNGTPLTLTLPTPVSFTIIHYSASAFVVIEDAGNIASSYPNGSGTLSYAVNGEPSLFFGSLGSGFTGGDTHADDLVLYPQSSTGVGEGDLLTLNEGSFTTSGNFSATAPVDGNYNVFIQDIMGTNISVAAVPEPSSFAAIAGAASLCAVAFRRRKRVAPKGSA